MRKCRASLSFFFSFSPGRRDALPDAAIESRGAHGKISGEQSCNRLVANLAAVSDETAQRVKAPVRSGVIYSSSGGGFVYEKYRGRGVEGEGRGEERWGEERGGEKEFGNIIHISHKRKSQKKIINRRHYFARRQNFSIPQVLGGSQSGGTLRERLILELLREGCVAATTTKILKTPLSLFF